MYKNAYQHGLVTIFSGAGSNPLLIWGVYVKNGHIQTLMDPEIKSRVVDIMGLNVSTTYITCPKNLKQSLGIHLPFMVMIIKNLHKYFTFEVTIRDQSERRRRFRVSNFQSTTTIQPFCTAMPIGLSGGWNQIQFNLAEFTRRAYKMQFCEVVRVQVNANARVRRIYFAERLYDESELPSEYKLYFPVKSTSGRKPVRPMPEINAAEAVITNEKETSKESLTAKPSATVIPVPSKAGESKEIVKDPSVSKTSKASLQISAKGSLITIADDEVISVKSAGEVKGLQETEDTTVVLLQKNDVNSEGKKSSKNGSIEEIKTSKIGSIEERTSNKSVFAPAEDVNTDEQEKTKEALNTKEGTDKNETGEEGDGAVLLEEQRLSPKIRSLDVITEETPSATKIE